MQAKDGHVEELEKRVTEEQEKVVGFISELTTNEALVKADTTPKEALDKAKKKSANSFVIKDESDISMLEAESPARHSKKWQVINK